MNMFPDDDGISWRRVWKCGDCSKHGYKMLSCDHCKEALRPRGCSRLLGAPGTAMSRRLTGLCLSHAAFPKTVPCQALFF
jgi:hypothetical protein